MLKLNKLTVGSIVLLLFFAVLSGLSSFSIGGSFESLPSSYVENIDLDFNSNSSYLFIPKQDGTLSSLRVTGYFEGDSFLIMLGDKEVYSYGYENVDNTALIISDGSGEVNIDFDYGNNSGYDDNNDGITFKENVIDFNVNAFFNFEVDYSKLCTKYTINNLDENDSSSLCYGNLECCSFLNLESSSSGWNDSLYLNFGKNGVGYNNTVDAQIVYYDINLSNENLHSNIYNSEIKRLDAVFTNRINFEEVCFESCDLSYLNENSYDLDIKTGGFLHVGNLSYSLEENSPRMYTFGSPPACSGNLSSVTFSVVTGTPQCGSLIRIRLNDGRQISALNCNDYYDLFFDDGCWNKGNYKNVTLVLPENLTNDSQIMSSPLFRTLSINTISYNWDLQCNLTGNYTINVTLDDGAGGECQQNLSLSVDSWSTSPSLTLNFSITPNLTIGQNFTLNITINNSGTDNATSIYGTFTSLNISAINLSGAINISFIQNGTANITNYTFTALAGGDYNFSTTTITYRRSSGIEMEPLGIQHSNTFHINYNPTLAQIPNITLKWNASNNYSVIPFNNSINLTEGAGYFSDQDSYDNCTTVSWNYTDLTGKNLSLTMEDCVLDIAAQNNWTGRINITLNVTDTYNKSTEINFSVFVSNETEELCNGIDEDGDTLVDEGCDDDNDDYCDNSMNITVGSTLTICSNTITTNASTIASSDDCNDGSYSVNPGVSETCGNSIDDNCDGLTDTQDSNSCSTTQNTGGSGGSGSSPTSIVVTETTTETPKEPEIPVEQPVQPVVQESFSPAEDVYKEVVESIISERFRLNREIVVTGDRTQVTEKLKALDLAGLENVILKVEIPKRIERYASSIVKIDDFEVIKEDPEIGFDLGNMDPLRVKSVQYVINKRLTRKDIESIISNITLKEVSDEERKIELEKQINETQKYVNLTQEVKIDYEKNQTEFKIKIDYNANETIIGDVYIYTEIPKCLVEIIKNELIESDQEFEIISEDPLIVWHFKSLLDVKEINYNIKAIADEDCANKAKALAIAKQIVQVKFSPKKSKILWTVSIIPIIIILMWLFGRFSEKVEHKNPKIQRLIHYIKHHYRHGFHEHHIRDKLLKEGYKLDDIKEALKLNAKNKLHYLMQRFEIGFEEFILLILIISSVMEFTQLLPSDVNYLQKMITWTISAFLLYNISITQLIFGVRKRIVDLVLIISYFLMILKDFVTFANMSFGEAIKNNAYVTDLYAYITQNNNVFEIYCFIIGAVLVTLIALYLAIKEEVIAPSFLSIVHFHPKKSKNPLKVLLRFVINIGVLFAFFVVIFNLMMEWLALVLDSFILTIILIVMFLILMKHRKKFTAEKFMYEVTEANERFYEKFISLFHYKKIVLLGFSGMLIMHILTELGNFLVPYITGIKDPIYFGHFYENHVQIFNIIPVETKSLFLMQSAGMPIATKIIIFAGYALNVVAALYLILLPAYIWYHMFKNRKLPLNHIPKMNFSKTNILLSATSISFLLLNSAFAMLPIKKAALVGVDIQTRLLDLTYINTELLIAAGIGLIALAASIKHINAIKKFVLTASVAFFAYYAYLFFNNVIKYYIGSIKELVLENPVITGYMILFLIINLVFYVLGLFSFFVELYIRREIWFEKYSINVIDKYYKKHHKFHLIHHPNSHRENLHGKKEEYLENYIKYHMMEGEQMMIIQDHLERQGWPRSVIKYASKNVLEDKNIIDFINKINKIGKKSSM